MGLFDDVLEASSGARVISEQHDTSKISIGSQDFDGDVAKRIAAISPGGWDANEYGITREQAIARIQAADTPEAREKAVQDIRNRAIRRANLDTSNGRVNLAVANRPAWHGLGVLFDKEFTRKEGQDASGTNFTLELVDASYTWNGELRKYPDVKIVVRTDTGAHLANVGKRYTPYQCDDLWDFNDDVLGVNGAHNECAGVLDGGRGVFILSRLDKVLEPVPGDITETFMLFYNRNDGLSQIVTLPTSNRVECQNTTRLALLNGRGKGFSVRHTKNAKARMEIAAKAMGFTLKSVEKHAEVCDTMVRKELNVRHYCNDVLDAVLDVSQAEMMKGPILDSVLHVTQAERDLAEKSFERKVKHRKELLSDILERHDSNTCKPHGTAYGAWNAVGEAIDHGSKFKKFRGGTYQERQEKRFESVLMGDGDDVKQVALEMAMRS